MPKVVIQEQAFRRLVIDIDPFIHSRPNRNTIIFKHESAAKAAANVVEAWVERASSGIAPDTRSGYLPDLILEHASEWGLQ